MKTLNIQIGKHFIERIQERFHVKHDEILSTLNTTLSEGYVNTRNSHIFFPLISGIVPLGKNLYNEAHYFAPTIKSSIQGENIYITKKFFRKINWYVNPESEQEN